MRERQRFAHGADIGVRGRGDTLAAAFEEAALELTCIVADPGRVRPLDVVHVYCRVFDRDLLLVEWLNAIVFEMRTRNMVFSRFDVRIDDCELVARIYGEPLDPLRHEAANHVRGVSDRDVAVEHEPDGSWLAQCLLVA
jgi:protein archease